MGVGISVLIALKATTLLLCFVYLRNLGFTLFSLPFLYSSLVSFLVSIASHPSIDLPMLLGKTTDGRFPIVPLILFSPYLYFVRIFSFLRRLRSGEAPYTQVHEGLYVGGWPSSPRMLPPGNPAIIDCTCEFPRVKDFTVGLPYRCIPTWDTRSPQPADIESVVKWASRKRDLNTPIFVHCAYGHGRSVAVMCALLVALGIAEDWKNAEKLIKQKRPYIQLLPKCQLRKFDDSGHFLFLEGNIDLVTIIKGTSYYRRGKYHDYASDFIPPTPEEAQKVIESNRLVNLVTSAVMLSTLEDGTIVKGLAGIPSEGPVVFVGYHMLLGFEKVPLVSRIYMERNILVRGIAHPMMFTRARNGKMPDLSSFDSFRVMGAVPVAPTNLFKLFSSKSHILLYPGGMREALHRKGEEYKLFWPEQSEFVRMAARFGAKIVPFGAVGEDDFGQVVFDYDDLVKIPYFKSEIESLTNEVTQLRTDASGEVANQPVHMPGILPKVPGRFYYYFGKPIETEGRKQELKDREKSLEFYLQVKSEVEKSIAYLKEKRESDPYRSIVSRLLYQATHGFESEVPTFDI